MYPMYCVQFCIYCTCIQVRFSRLRMYTIHTWHSYITPHLTTPTNVRDNHWYRFPKNNKYVYNSIYYCVSNKFFHLWITLFLCRQCVFIPSRIVLNVPSETSTQKSYTRLSSQRLLIRWDLSFNILAIWISVFT